MRDDKKLLTQTTDTQSLLQHSVDLWNTLNGQPTKIDEIGNSPEELRAVRARYARIKVTEHNQLCVEGTELEGDKALAYLKSLYTVTTPSLDHLFALANVSRCSS